MDTLFADAPDAEQAPQATSNVEAAVVQRFASAQLARLRDAHERWMLRGWEINNLSAAILAKETELELLEKRIIPGANDATVNLAAQAAKRAAEATAALKQGSGVTLG